MDTPQPSPVPQRLRRLWRQARWHRRKFAALCAAVAVFAALDVLRPTPPPTVRVITARHDLAAGATLTDGDLDTAAWPASQAPAHAVGRDRLLGRRLNSGVAHGTPLTSLSVAGDAWSNLRSGHVAVAVRLQDSALADLLAPGQRVQLAAVDPRSPSDTRIVTSEAVVLAVPRSDTRTTASQASRLVVFDVRADESGQVISSAVSRYLTAIWGR